MRLSQTASDVLLNAVRAAELADGRCPRLVRQDDGYALTIDVPSGWDKVVQVEGTSVLILSADVDRSLGDSLIDVKEDDGAFQLLVVTSGTASTEAA